MSDADCTPGREPRSVAASSNYYDIKINNICINTSSKVTQKLAVNKSLKKNKNLRVLPDCTKFSLAATSGEQI